MDFWGPMPILGSKKKPEINSLKTKSKINSSCLVIYQQLMDETLGAPSFYEQKGFV